MGRYCVVYFGVWLASRFPKIDFACCGAVRRITCTKNKLIFDFTPSSHASESRSRFDASPPPRMPLVARLLMILHHFLVCGFATAALELLRVIPKRRVPFSRQNNGEDVGKGLVQDVNHYKDDPADYSGSAPKAGP
jgi:hypothetical protein